MGRDRRPMNESRLLDISQSAEYLGLSVEAVKSYIKLRFIVPVPMPSCRSRNKKMRRVLIDRYDLDRLIDAQKVSNGKRVPQREALVDKILRERRAGTRKFTVLD